MKVWLFNVLVCLLFAFIFNLIFHRLKSAVRGITAKISHHPDRIAPPDAIEIENKEQGSATQKSDPKKQVWKNITSYQQGEPTTYEARVGALRVVIAFGHVLHPSQWVMHCKTLSIDTHPLKLWIDLEQAKAETISTIEERIADLASCLEKIKNEKQ